MNTTPESSSDNGAKVGSEAGRRGDDERDFPLLPKFSHFEEISLTQTAANDVRRGFAIPLLILVTCVVFGRLLGAEFTWWDDQTTVHHNPLFNPATLEAIRHYWSTPREGLYVPITSSAWAGIASLAFVGFPDSSGISLNPLLFHLTNLVVHLCSCLLTLAILRRMLRDEVAALLGALLFAVHPVQVETVAWVSGLKDLLGGCFSLACVLLYLRGHGRSGASGRSIWRGASLPLALLALALAILSKPSAVVVPAILWAIGGLVLRRRWLRGAVELSPFFAVALTGAIVARWAQHVEHLAAPPLWQRPFVAGDALCFYLAKLAWPALLTIDYGRTPAAVMASPWTYLRWLVPAALGIALFLARRRLPLPAAAGAVLLIAVAPVLGLTPFQMQFYSTVTDHYLYLAMLGPAIALGYAMTRWRGAVPLGLAAAVLVALAARAWAQTAVWHDSLTLFGHAIAANDRSFAARANLAILYLAQDPPRPDLAEPYADAAHALAPTNVHVLDAYADTKFVLGKRAEALDAWEQLDATMAAAGRPADATRAGVATRIARRLLEAGDRERALDWARRAVASAPGDPHAEAVHADARKAMAKPPTTGTTRPAASGPAR